MNKSFFGIDTLIEKLKNLFYLHLKQFLPTIYNSLQEKKVECTKILESLGDMSFHGNLVMTINTLILKFSSQVERIFSGKEIDNEKLNILPKIKEKFFDFLKDFKTQYKPSQFLKVIT